MSDFFDMMVEMLPAHSQLQQKDNPLRTVLDKSLGEFMETLNSDSVLDGLFLESATGGWLDAHGQDYGVRRKQGESDEDYRNRIIFEKLEYLTAQNLKDIYGVELYAFVENFNVNNNDLTSDNPYITSKYMGIADNTTKAIVNNKFVLDGGVTWL